MNQTEKRRKILLEQTKNLYSERRVTPAVHPRYKAYYNQLYPDETEVMNGFFGLRVMACIIAFAVYIIAENSGGTICGYDNMQIVNTITYNFLSKLF